MKKEACIIGINKCNTDNVIGPTIYSMVIVKPDFFRKFPWIKQTDVISEINKSVELTDKYVEQFEIHYIKPKEVIEKEDISDIKAIISLLNRRHRFWEDKIYINTSIEKDYFVGLFKQTIPQNLNVANLHMDKWMVSSLKSRVTTLAYLYAKYNCLNEVNMVRGVWGDFGTGLPDDPKLQEFIKQNPDCPHIKIKYRGVK